MSPVLFLVAVAHAVNDLYMGMLAPLYTVIRDRFELSLSLVGTISMVAGVASAFSQPVFGALFDRRGVAISLHLAPLATAVFICLLSLAPSFPWLLVLLFLGCLGSAAFHPKGASVTPSLSGPHPEIGMAVFSSVGNLGFASGPTVIAFLVAGLGWAASPLLIAPAALVSALLLLLLPPRAVEERSSRAARSTFRELLADRRETAVLARLVFVNFCLTVGVRGMSTFLPVRLADLGEPLTRVGVFFTVMLALGAVLSVAASSLARRWGCRPFILSSLLVGSPLFAAGMLAGGAAGSALLLAAGSALSWSSPLLILQAQRHSGGSPAMASSLLMGISWGLAGLAMAPLGALGEAIGTRNLLLVTAVFPLLGVLSALRLPAE